ncbi:MAG TPA: hypothetical protein VFY40_04795 [Blastocatellia bacterium]|nr:hypothetical protein [Blastocatellia bacterium]
MNRILIAIAICALTAGVAGAQNVSVNPTGVNVNPNTGTTVFLTFGQVPVSLRPAEATWCGELIPAAPDLGFKCDPATIFGSLPARYNLSRSSGNLGFTDVMSIPPSVARRAYQAAIDGFDSRFFYVRRFANLGGGPDEYVNVTCRLASGGARTPFALTDARLLFEPDLPIVFIRPQAVTPKIKADIQYNGTGRLKGRWEVVAPGDELPADFDLLPEGSLPFEQRGKQRRYTQLGRFNVFLPPVGRFTLEGPDPARLPRAIEGAYLILLRIEASDDKEGDSDLSAVGAGPGVVHSGGLSGFAMPVLRYFVGSSESQAVAPLTLISPAEGATINSAQSPIFTLLFTWTENQACAFVRLEVMDRNEKPLLNSMLPAGTLHYYAPSWFREKAVDGNLRWRVVMFDQAGQSIAAAPWRELRLETPAARPRQ